MHGLNEPCKPLPKLVTLSQHLKRMSSRRPCLAAAVCDSLYMTQCTWLAEWQDCSCGLSSQEHRLAGSLTWAPAVANLSWDQWWSIPLKACLPWNSITALASSATSPAASKGAKGSLKRRTLQSVEQETATSPLGIIEMPRTGPACCAKWLWLAGRLMHVIMCKL